MKPTTQRIEAYKRQIDAWESVEGSTCFGSPYTRLGSTCASCGRVITLSRCWETKCYLDVFWAKKNIERLQKGLGEV
jgi:hypothetical protein